MSNGWIQDIVDEYVTSLETTGEFEVLRAEPTSLFLCSLRSRCVAAAIGVIPPESELDVFVSDAEDELREWRDRYDWGQLDLNLVIITERELPMEVLSRVRRNTVLCRKFVLSAATPAEARLQFTCLPFSPINNAEGESLQVLSLNPSSLLRRSGASEGFARDLIAHQPGASALAKNALRACNTIT